MFLSKKTLILLGALAFLLFFMFVPLRHLVNNPSSYLSPKSPQSTLSAEELNSFLNLWADFIHRDISKHMAHISLSSDSEIPAQVERWLEANGWNASRFFATEQRLRELVAIATLKNNVESNQKLKSKSDANLQTVFAEQEKQLKSLSYNQEEIAMVQENLSQIVSILNGK